MQFVKINCLVQVGRIYGMEKKYDEDERNENKTKEI